MGSSYANITLRHAAPAVEAVLRQFNHASYVAPLTDGFCGVFPRDADESGDPEHLGTVAATLSFHLRTPVVSALNHDEDVLLMGLFEQGELRMEWGWKPPLTSWAIPGTPRAQFEEAVRTALGTRPVQVPRTGGLVRRAFDQLFPSQQHARTSAACGIPQDMVGAGWRYIHARDVPRTLLDAARPVA